MKKLSELMGNKKKRYVIIGIVGIVAISLFVSTMWVLQNKKTIELNKENVLVEYGKTYTPELKDIVKNYKDFKKDELKLETTIKNEDTKPYPAIGKYEIKVTYNKNEVKQVVEVKDTTKPEMTVPENIEIIQGTDLTTFDFKSFFTTTDLTELSDYEIDYSNIDSNNVGEYIVKVSIEDKYKNKTKKDVKVTIITKPEIASDEVIVQEVITNDDGSTTIKNSVKKKTETTSGNTTTNSNSSTNNSSNSSNSSSNNNPSTNGNTGGSSSGGSSSGGSSSGGSSSGEDNKPKPHDCSTQGHSISVGNTGKWFSSSSAVESYFDERQVYWGKQCESGVIDYETYMKKCPSRYETWKCSYCGKYTSNFFYGN